MAALSFQGRDDAEVTTWSNGVFGLGQGYLGALARCVDEFDVAVVIRTLDVVTQNQDVLSQAPEDNIMFELGLLTWRLGRSRTYVVIQDGPALGSGSCAIRGVAVRDSSKDPTSVPRLFGLREDAVF